MRKISLAPDKDRVAAFKARPSRRETLCARCRIASTGASAGASHFRLSTKIVSRKSAIDRGMQRDAIAFAVEHNRAESVRTDGFGRLDDSSPQGLDLAYGVADAPFHVHIKEYSARRGDLVACRHQATAVPLVVLNDAKAESVEFVLLDIDAEHRAIESGRAIQIGYGDVEPYRAVVHRVQVAHGSSSMGCTFDRSLAGRTREAGSTMLRVATIQAVADRGLRLCRQVQFRTLLIRNFRTSSFRPLTEAARKAAAGPA